ncbi:MAG: hypothetical protein IKB07_00365 [Lachnospiraceae bacterium]|nr:hypothetical protein [Lachnospiraceae bacterium]
MERVFLSMFNMSLIASLLAIAVLALRLVLKRTPKALFCILWGFVAIRLIFPFSPESPFSLIPASLTETDSLLSEHIPSMEVNDLQETGSYATTQTMTSLSDEVLISFEEANTRLSASDTPEASLPQPSGAIVTSLPATETSLSGTENVFLRGVSLFAGIFWPVGILVMLLYASISYVRIHKRVKETVPLSDNILLCDHTSTPFILGIFRPRIILPSSIRPEEAPHVIAHEQAHLKRLDHIWKPLGFVLLSFYWFNPVLWIAYIYLCKDIELACDERVIQKMDTDSVKSYSSTLLHYSISRKAVSFCPLAFGEVHVKKRIKNVLHYKRPAFWVIVLATVSCIAVAVCFLTNPVIPTPEETKSESEEPLFFSLALTDTGSDVEGCEISTESFLCFPGNPSEPPTISVEWTNQNNRKLTYKEGFDVLRYENDSWVSCATEEHPFAGNSHVLLRKTSRTESYSLAGFDLSKDGLYRFRTEPEEGKYLWFDFELFYVYESNAGALPDSILLSIAQTVTKNRISTTGIRDEYPDLYDILLLNGDATVTCFVNHISSAEESGVREFFMAQICSELTGIGAEEGEYDPETWWSTGEQWLNIYRNRLITEKYNELALRAGNEPTTTTASWKNISLLSDTGYPKTPLPRLLVWTNYWYNKEKNPDGSLVLELPEFPGVTLYADSQKICATISGKTQTLISGNTLFTTYLADLNEDSYPEICATVSPETAPGNLEIVVYDLKNNCSYALRDSDRYSYALFGAYNTMFVQKIDRTGAEPDFVGNLYLSGEADDTAFLFMTAARESLYRSSKTKASLKIDLLSYSDLYGDLVAANTHWPKEEFPVICMFRTPESWAYFAAKYSDMIIWMDHKLLTITEAFDATVTSYFEQYRDTDYSIAIFMSPHCLIPMVGDFPNGQNITSFRLSPLS